MSLLFALSLGVFNVALAGPHDADLQNIQDDVSIRAQEFIDSHFDSGIPAASDFTSALNYTLAALHKNQDAANANQLLIDTLDLHTWDATIAGKTNFYFQIGSFLQIWYFFNQNSEYLPGRLSTGSSGSEEALKAWFFDHLDVYTKIDSSDAGINKTWIVIDSENHDIIKKSTIYMMANALRDDVAYKDQVLPDGTTVAETALLWENYFSVWFNERARKGTLIEMVSPIYMKYTAMSIYLLREHGSLPQIRDHADQFLTLLFADYAQEYIRGARGGAKSRAYLDERYNLYGKIDSANAYSYLHYNYGSVSSLGNVAPSTSYVLWPAVLSSYRVPLEVMDIALYPDSKGDYEYRSTRPGYEPVTQSGAYNIKFPNYLSRYSYVTPEYVNGCFTIDTTRNYAKINSQNRWMGVNFASRADSRAFIYTNGLGGLTHDADGDGVSAYDSLNGVADGNAMILQKPSIATDDDGNRLYLSYDLFSTKEHDSGWVFGYDPNGKGYLGVKPAYGSISTSWVDIFWTRNPNGTYIVNGTSSGTNYGDSTDLKVENDSVNGSMSYLRFGHIGDVETGSATLRLYANSVTSGSGGAPVVNVYGLTDDDYDLGTMTWDSGSPNHSATGYSVTGVGSTATLVTTQTVSSSGSYYEFDVTSFVNDQLAQSVWGTGDTIFTFLVTSANADGSSVSFNSVRASSSKPELKVLTGKYSELSDEHAPVVFQTGSSDDYASFSDFKSDVKNNTFVWNSSASELEYVGTGSDSLKYYTNGALPKVNNVTVDLTPEKTYDSPYLDASYDSPLITITNTSNESITLDFSLAISPIAWWKLDESSGSSANDSSPNNYDGTVNGASWTSGQLGNALDFDGSNDYVELPTTTGMSSSAGSVSMLVNTNNSTAMGTLFYGAGVGGGNGFGTHDEMHVHVNSNGTIGLFIKGSTTNVNINSASSYDDGAWHHVVATWDVNGNAILYVDGLQVATASHDASEFDFSALMRLGTTGQSTVRNFDGLLDQVRLYNVPISLAFVQDLYAEISAPADPDGWWKLDETSGTIAEDSTSNNYDGTVNGSTWTSGVIGNALSFDGIDDYVELPATTGMTSSEGSVSIWVNANNVTATGMLFYGASVANGNGFGGHNELHLHMNGDGTLGLFLKGSTSVNISSSSSIDNGAWHHVAATWDIDGNAILYVDGAQVASATHDAYEFSFSAHMRLGTTGQSTVRNFDGLLDQVKIYKTALSASQIQLLANE